MKRFLVTYDLNQPDQNYPKLCKAIKMIAQSSYNCLDSVWIISHDGPADIVCDILQSYVNNNDKLLVTEITGEIALHGFKKKMLFLSDFSDFS